MMKSKAVLTTVLLVLTVTVTVLLAVAPEGGGDAAGVVSSALELVLHARVALWNTHRHTA